MITMETWSLTPQSHLITQLPLETAWNYLPLTVILTWWMSHLPSLNADSSIDQHKLPLTILQIDLQRKNSKW